MDVTLPNGQVLKGVPDGTTKAQLVQKLLSNGMQVPKEWLSVASSAPAEDPSQYGGAGGYNPMLSRLSGATDVLANGVGIQPGADMGNAANALGPAEMAANIGTGAVAMPLAGLAGIGQGAWNFAVPKRLEGPEAADRVRQVQSALTYQPRSAVGQGMTRVLTSPFQAATAATNYAGEKVTDVTGSPLLGATIKTVGDLAPALLMRGEGAPTRVSAKAPLETAPPTPTPSWTSRLTGRTEKKQLPPADPVEAAKNYARARGLDWNKLPAAFQQQLTKVATNADNLADLPAAAIERQGLLESLPVPVKGTRGILTRDPVELRNEGNVAATEAGKPIRESRVAANDALIQNLEVLKGTSTRGKGRADSPEQVGASLQGAARTKLKVQQAKVKRLYEEAEATGELQGRVSPRALVEAIEASPDKTHFGWVESWMNQMGVVQKGGLKKLTLKEMEDLRQAAVARAMNGGTEAHYASKVIGAIDKATEGAGGNAYQAARKARRDQAIEFEEQGGMAKLVENKSRTDRATALEDTWQKTVRGGSIEDLSRVKRSLLTGTSETKKAGVQAWRDLRAQTVQHIINEATKSVTRYENGSPNLTPASMEKAIKSIGKDKLEQIFDKRTVQQLDRIMEATRLVKTEPPPIHQGSSTFGNAIAFLERAVGRVPVIGNTTVGAIKGAGKLRQIGAGARAADRARTTPLDDAARASK